MAVRREKRVPVTAVALSAAAAGAAAGVAAQRRHAGRIRRDPRYARLTRKLAGRSLRVSSADGTRLHVERFGAQDGPTLVLAPGWTEQLSFWGPVIELLSGQGLRLIAFDLRGHGHSAPAASGDYALERFGEDVEAVLSAGTPEGERAVVAGHSLGGMAIAAWAQGHDVHARADAAALVNTGFGDLISGHLLFGEHARWLNHPGASRRILGSRAPIPRFSSPWQQALIRYAAFGPEASRAEVAFYEQMLIRCPANVRAACGVAMSDMDLWHAVARLTVPTLVVAGERDRLTPPAHARRIADALPRPAGLVEVADMGHMGPLEQPRAIARALAGLVRDRSRAAATL